jgi:hypothetical protein
MMEKEPMTDQTANIFTALAAAQIEMGAVTKGATNPAFKSKYADLADVASVVIPALAAKGVAVFHYIKPSDARDMMRTEFVHGATQTRIWCDVPLIVDKGNMQGYKSATTYAKRIGLESLSGVAPEGDDGNAAAQAAPRQHPRQPEPPRTGPDPVMIACDSLANADTLDQLAAIWRDLPPELQSMPSVRSAANRRKAALQPIINDEIPEHLK